MRADRFRILFPLVFLLLGMVFLFFAQKEFRAVATRDDATLRSDLAEAGLPRAQIAAFVSAQARVENNAASYTQLGTFFVLIIPIFMAIPLYAHLIAGKHTEK